TELDSRAERLRLSVMARRKGGCKRDPFTHDACRDYTGISENQPRRRLIGIFKLAHEQQTTLGQALANARSRIIGMTPPIRRKSLSSLVSMAAVACSVSIPPLARRTSTWMAQRGSRVAGSRFSSMVSPGIS